MKIAVPWHSRKERQIGDEYNITFVNKPNNFDNLMGFLSDHRDSRFNITVNDLEYPFDYTKLKVLNAIHPQVYVMLLEHQHRHYETLKKNNVKFFFDADFPVTDFRMFEYVCSLGVTDVFIEDDLCYNLRKVRKAADKYGVQLRLIINQIPSSLPTKTTDVRAPWFIPETVDELDKYIDIIEFEENSWVRMETLYKIWFNKKKWRGNLKAINPQLEIDIWNDSMIPDFIIYKMNCGYRCAYGSACKKCNQFVEMAKDLHDKGVEYVLKEDKGE